jgi:CheY-like chemotaxis protein
MHRPLKGTCATILVVDNDQAVRKAVVSILERANFRVLSANSGVEARAPVELLNNGTPKRQTENSALFRDPGADTDACGDRLSRTNSMYLAVRKGFP